MATSCGQVDTRSTATGTYRSNKRTTANSIPSTGRSRPRTAAIITGVGENEIICAISGLRGISPTMVFLLSTSLLLKLFCANSLTPKRMLGHATKLRSSGPSEIIYMKTAIDSKLLSIIRENVEVDKYDTRMTDIDGRYWSDSSGHEYVQQL